MNHKPIHWGSFWLLLLAACAGVLPLVETAQAETVLGKPISETDSIRISPRGSAHSEDRPRASSQTFSTTMLALVLTTAAIVVALKFWRHLRPASTQLHAPGAIQVLSHTPLGARGSVFLLQCGQRVLVVGASPTQLSTLAELTDPDEIDGLLRPAQKPAGKPSPQAPRAGANRTVPSGDLKGQLDSMLNNLEGWHETS